MKELIKNLKDRFNIADELQQRPELAFITCSSEKLVGLITHLRDIEKYTHLVFFTAVDFIEDNQFQLTYMLHNYETKSDLGIRVKIPRDKPVMESIHHLWRQAATYQRELHEMFGIDFPGSPRLDDSFILEGWTDVPPMRRDFDTKEYSETTYFPRPGRKTHDPETYMREKLYPEGEN